MKTKINKNETYEFFVNELPPFLRFTWQMPEKMYAWEDSIALNGIRLYKTKKECIEAACEYLEENDF